jgi:hypothetical protein
MMTIKNLSSADPRIRDIVKKHLRAARSAISEEIARELTEPLLEQWGLTREDLATPYNEVPEAAQAREPVTSATLIYDFDNADRPSDESQNFSNIHRRSVTTHLRFCTSAPALAPPRAKRKRKTRQPKKKP